MKALRDYQQSMNKSIYDLYRKNIRSVLAVAFTGWGKTVLTATMSKQMLKDNFYIVVVVKTRRLVTNLSDEFREMGITHSVMMPGHEDKYDPSLPVQICSIDTLDARKSYPFTERENIFLVLDEAHMTKSRQFQELIAAYDNPHILGVTATPFNGLSHFDEYVESITPKQLMEQGYLSPYTYIGPPIKIDTSKVDVRAGEFVISQLDLEAKKIFGDIIDSFNQFNMERRPTLAFFPSVKTSKEAAETFRIRGIKAVHIDADCTDEQRDQAERDLKSGKVTIVCNVALWTTGINIPEIKCIIDAAPTHSLNLWIQKIGRGSRIHESFKDCLLIDHAGNLHRHGSFYEDREITLKENKKSTIDCEIEKMQSCPSCFRYFKPGPPACPFCNEQRKIKVPKISKMDGQLVYLTEDDFVTNEHTKRKQIASNKFSFMKKAANSARFLQRKYGNQDPYFVPKQVLKKYEAKYGDENFFWENYPVPDGFYESVKGTKKIDISQFL